MSKITRRDFLKIGLAGVAGVSLSGPAMARLKPFLPAEAQVDRVKLGKTGLTVSRVALGTGTVGVNHSSNQTRLGMEPFVEMAHRAYDRGIRFYDMADMYGSHTYVGKALKSIPRENVTLMSKMWTYDDGSDKVEPVRGNIDRFRLEIGTDYIDILLMHCIMQGNWPETRKHYMEGFARAKEDGIVRAVGLSCHNWDAMVTAVDCPWVDVILARVNPFSTLMDGNPEAVKDLLAKARANGKGIIGMKIFGEGRHVSDEERERSIRFALAESNVHCMTLGMESVAQVDDAADRVMRIAKEVGAKRRG